MKKTTKRSLALALLMGASAAVGVDTAQASSHREAPAITEDPTVDCTDVYSFVSPDRPNTITVIANYIPLEEPSGGPNYYRFSDTALYEIHIDNDGDAVEDVTFQLRFTTTTKNDATFLYNTGPVSVAASGDDYDNLNVVQRYTITRVDGDRRRGRRTVLGSNILVAPTNIGPKSMPGYSALVAPAIKALSDGTTVFCGPRDDPFFINLGRTFDLLNIDPVLPGGILGGGTDHLAGFNCHTIALQIPMHLITSDGATPTDPTQPSSIVGIWSTASRKQVRLKRTKGGKPVVGGAWVQVSRLGMPLVNEVVIPRKDKDIFNNAEPKDDTQFLDYITNPELAGIFSLLFGPQGLNPVGLTTPPAPRTDLVQAFLTGLPGLNEKGTPCEYQRLNMAITPTPLNTQNRLGALAGQIDGFPNGRRLADDVVDIALRVVHGVLVDGNTYSVQLGDRVTQNDRPFLATFPYVAEPNDGVSRQHQSE